MILAVTLGTIDSLEAEVDTNEAANVDTGVDASCERNVEIGAVAKDQSGEPVANTDENALLREEESGFNIQCSGSRGDTLSSWRWGRTRIIETRRVTQASTSTWAKGVVISSLTIASTATLRAATIVAVGPSQLDGAGLIKG